VKFSLQEVYFSDVNTKLTIARTLFEEVGRYLTECGDIRISLELIKKLERNLQNQMAAMHMSTLCSQCGSQKGGGCCSIVMANETDAVLFLMNMLLGREITRYRDDGFECFFLGNKGCTLLLKPFFCLNYNCKKIMSGNTREDIAKLEKTSAHLLNQQFALEQMIRNELKRKKLLALCS